MYSNNVTRSSRIMLPTYIGVNVLTGVEWMLQSKMRTSPSLDAVRDLMPVPIIGGIVLAVAVFMVIAMCLHNRTFACLLLLTNSLVWLALAGLFASNLVTNVSASLAGPNLSVGWAIANFASFVTLFWHEGDPNGEIR